MPSFAERLEDGWERAASNLPLALVPFVVSLLQFDDIATVAAFDGVRLGVRFGLPGPVVGLWQFVNVPVRGATADTGLPVGVGPGSEVGAALGLLGVVLVVTPLYAAVTAALAAGYLGSVRTVLATGRYEFVEGVRRHFVPLFLYALAVLALQLALLVPALFLLGAGGFGAGYLLVVLAVPVFFALAYLFYAAPFLVVLRGAGLLDALRGSYELATDGGPYLRFAVGYCVLVVALSIVATPVVVGLGVAGVLFGAVATAPVSLTLAFTTVRFLADVDPQSPTFGVEPGSGPRLEDGFEGTDTAD
ncbi:hypothetical protein ACFO0N_04695 [Halobium salinum]|uniref:DUF4013 domain-containing protein n=1 Tax=Halobium salinum TaxID=1364940 RepID=A0ABD5P9U8_9EURY|nr:hypothetical protein [Halobium salinum]